MGTEKETSRIKAFFASFIKESRGSRLFIAIICVVALALFFHFRQARIEMLEINSKAPQFVVSQVDFEFPDEESTIILRQEALRDVGNIYKIDEREIRQARFQFEDFLVQSRSQKVPELSFEELYKAGDAFEDVMIQTRFVSEETFRRLREENIPTTYYQVFDIDASDTIKLPERVWDRMLALTEKLDRFNPKAFSYVVSFFEEKSWSLEEDIQAKTALMDFIAQSVPEKFTRIKAGTKIIDQGERVTARHLAMLNSMKEALNQSRKLKEPLPIISSILFALTFVALSGFYFAMNQPELYYSSQKLALLATIVILTLLFAKITELFILKQSGIMEAINFPLITPFATLLICILLYSRTALFISCFLAILLAITLAVDHSKFLIVNLVTSLVVIICTKSLRKRKEVFIVSVKSYVSIVPVIFAFHFAANKLWSTTLGADLISAAFFMTLSAVLVVGLLPLMETTFKVMTDMTLMEFMNPNNELLRRMTLEVPGTYQHSLILGNITEAMAQSINANSLFCKVATLYHDIGKLNNPQFFTENQQRGVNIHQLLTPVESAEVIISHVTDGEMLARKYRLPQSFIDVIREHHGTTLVYYFYHKELELKGGDPSQVDESKFRYPGPKPKTKESAIIMIADTIEAASRSLDDTSEAQITAFIDKLVKERVDGGQLDECILTFEELGKIKKALVKTMLHSHHIRVKYPERVKNP
jgi:cyclic-di-AMP phosphodiesterase PgpH